MSAADTFLPSSPTPPNPVRTSAQRPLPAFFAILVLIGCMVLVSMLLGGKSEQEPNRVTLPENASGELAAE